MLIKLKLFLAIAGGLGFLALGFSHSVGWLLGWGSLFLMAFFREKYYGVLLNKDQFSKGNFARYIILVFLVLWTAPIIAFIFPEVVNPYTLIATYFIDRFIFFIGNIFK